MVVQQLSVCFVLDCDPWIPEDAVLKLGAQRLMLLHLFQHRCKIPILLFVATPLECVGTQPTSNALKMCAPMLLLLLLMWHHLPVHTNRMQTRHCERVRTADVATRPAEVPIAPWSTWGLEAALEEASHKRVQAVRSLLATRTMFDRIDSQPLAIVCIDPRINLAVRQTTQYEPQRCGWVKHQWTKLADVSHVLMYP